MKEKSALWVPYLIAVIGDLNYALLTTTSILYGVMLDATPSQNGLIGGAYGLSYIITAVLLGRAGDKMPRKRALTFCTIGQVSVSVLFLFLFSTVPQLIMGQLILGGINGFFYPSIEAYLSEKTHETKLAHQKAISNYCVSWSIGYTIGPFLAGIFSDNDVKISFLISFIFYTVAFLSVILFLPNQKKNENYEDKVTLVRKGNENLVKNEKNNEKNSIDRILLMRILFGMFVFAMLNNVVITYFADFSSRPEGLNFSGTLIGQIIFIFGVGRTLYFILSRYVESSLKKINYSYLLISSLMLLLILMNRPFFIGFIYFFIGILCGLIYKFSLDLLMQHEEEAKGAKAGLFESIYGLGTAFSTIIAGLLAEIFLMLPFIVFATISSMIFLINLYLEKK